jgi:quinol-cytochrome oxidoreductase complex cytochrome b subunit
MEVSGQIYAPASLSLGKEPPVPSWYVLYKYECIRNFTAIVLRNLKPRDVKLVTEHAGFEILTAVIMKRYV